ncbi:uncharacterized protein LOC135502850 [Lineus longissimus]|uniref:uncharacterized protein LOC135487642 n=1 Tax=Lineus longissimus TaxID=88925 RepID=UPI002B4C4AE9
MANLWDTLAEMRFEPGSGDEETGPGPNDGGSGDAPPKNPKSTGKAGAKTIRYNPSFDVTLLREIRARNPYEDADRWAVITQNFNSAMLKIKPGAVPVNDRSVKERVDRLINAFKTQQMAALRKSGTAEEYEEREILLQEILTMKSDSHERKKTASTSSNKNDKRLIEAGTEIRKRAMETLIGDKDENKAPSNTPRKKKKEVMTDYTKMKQEEINLKNEELAFKREQFELEKEERRHRMELEKTKEQQFSAIFQQFIESQQLKK